MDACFGDLVTGQGEGCGWRLPKSGIKKIAEDIDLSCENAVNDACSIHDAMLWGGNLTMLASLVGTPYLPVVKNGILFIEDVGEHPYRVERMLAQLLQAGVLNQQKAIIFGQFSHYKLVAHDKGYKMDSVFTWLQSQVTAQVLTGLPFGHIATKVVLPVGLPVTLAIEGRDVFLLWGHQH
jgi:muramoyltetrapeptide carboxypeptidase